MRPMFSLICSALIGVSLAIATVVMIPIEAGVRLAKSLFVAYVPRPLETRRDLLARFALVAANRNRQMASFAF